MKRAKLNLHTLQVESFSTSTKDSIKAGLKQVAISNPSFLDCPTEQFGGCPTTVIGIDG